jgi:hypothetical protein
MQLAHSLPDALWKSMLKALAEASGRFQEKDSSPFFGFDPQFGEEVKSSIPRLWITGIVEANPQACVGGRESSCLQISGKPINPTIRLPTIYFRLFF